LRKFHGPQPRVILGRALGGGGEHSGKLDHRRRVKNRA
jgi:hypothetical protein